MSLETVVEDIREAAREEAAAIRDAAEQEADEIVAEAEAEADEIRAAAEQEAEREADQEHERAVSTAKLEARQARLDARQDVLADLHEAVEDAVADIDGERRAELTRAALDAALDEFDDDAALEVFGRADDEDLLRDILDDDAYDRCHHAGTVDCLGGVVVESDATRVRVDNTFDATLESVWEDSLREVSDRLFEDDA